MRRRIHTDTKPTPLQVFSKLIRGACCGMYPVCILLLMYISSSSLTAFGDIAKLIGKQWSEMTPAAKQATH